MKNDDDDELKQYRSVSDLKMVFCKLTDVLFQYGNMKRTHVKPFLAFVLRLRSLPSFPFCAFTTSACA